MKNIDIPFYEVDAHNLVPCWTASSKQEYSAHTLRTRIHRLLPEFLNDFPSLKKHPYNWEEKIGVIDWRKSLKTLDIDFTIKEVDWVQSGEKAAHPYSKG